MKKKIILEQSSRIDLNKAFEAGCISKYEWIKPESIKVDRLTDGRDVIAAKNLKGDLLLIHGSVDDVVVPQHNYALNKKFVELGIQVDFYSYPMHKHNVIGKDRVHLMEKVLRYVIENN